MKIKTYFHDSSNTVILDKKKKKRKVSRNLSLSPIRVTKREETFVWKRTKIFPVFSTRNKSRKSTCRAQSGKNFYDTVETTFTTCVVEHLRDHVCVGSLAELYHCESSETNNRYREKERER